MKIFIQFVFNLTSAKEKSKIIMYLSVLGLGVSLEGLGFYGFSVLVKSRIVSESAPFAPIYFIQDELHLGLVVITLILLRTIICAWALQKISQNVISTQSRFSGIYLKSMVRNSGGQNQMSPSEISRSIETSTSYVFSAMQSLILIFGELFSMVTIFIVALCVSGFGFLVLTFPVIGVVLIIGRILKPRLTQSAENLSIEARNYVNDAMEASSLSQVIFGEQRLHFLTNRFVLSRQRSGNAYSKVIFIQQLPRYILETTTIILLAISFVVSSDALLSSLTLTAPLLLRLLPSLIKFSNLQFDVVKGKPFLEKLQSELNTFQSEKFASSFEAQHSSQVNLSVFDLQPQIGNGYLNDPLNFEVSQGEIIGIVGPSGSGKSSLIECLVKKRNFLGTIEVSGPDIIDNEYSFSYVPQASVFLRDSILNNLLLGNPLTSPESRAREALIKSGLPQFIDKLNEQIDDYGSNGLRLSGGERARLSFARALIAEPSVIILDELTSGLDEVTEQQILETISVIRQDKIILIVTHKPSVMRICDRLIPIRRSSGT